MYNSNNKNKRKQYLKYVMQKQSQSENISILNKKKIRNWPVLIKRLLQMQGQYLFDTPQSFKQYLIDNCQCIYMKLQIDPFNRFVKRNPPMWYRKLFIDALMNVYANWKNLADTLSEDYYLKIWVFEPNFYDSQVVLAIGDRITWYQGLFEEHETNIDFPHEQYSNLENGNDTKKIIWEIKKNVTPYTDDDLLLSKKHIKNKMNKGKAWEVSDKVYGKLTIIHNSDVWIGGS